MQRFHDHDELDEEEASGGVKNHGARYVLIISLFMALALMSAMWIVAALSN